MDTTAREPHAESLEAHQPARVPHWLEVSGSIAWRLIGMAVATWVLIQVMGQIQLVVIPFAIGLIIAALLSPVARFLRARKVPRWLAALLPLLLFVGAITGIIAFFVRGVVRQWSALSESFREGWIEITRVLSGLGIDLSVSGFEDVTEQLGTENVASRAYETAYATVELLGGIALVLVFAFFLVRDGDRIGEALLRFFPRARRARARHAAGRGWHTLERYIIGLTIVASVNTILTGIALVALSIPMVVPLLLLTFLLCFVPFVGTILAISAGALIALAERGLEVALIFLALGLVIELLESNVTQPLVQGRVLHMHPIIVVAVVTAGTVLLGIPGAFLAVPLAAVISAVASALIEQGESVPDR